MRPLLFAALLLAFAAPASAQLSADLAFPNLTFSSPVGVEHDPVNPDLLYVVEQRGVIRVFDNDPDVSTTSVFLDIDDRVTSGGETGLLGLAFHPDYETNGYFYVNYTVASPLRSRVSRFSRSTANPQQGDPDSELVLLDIAQPFSNHNGGGLAFGPDGYLYASFGDGGSGGDPEENGQDPTTLLGAILRLDVDGGGTAPDCGGPGANYTVPPNAIADGPGGSCDEIYAWGLRNPWRFSFDRETGEGWIADVGQGAWEEVDRMEDGGNYGWNTYEGNACFDGPCDPEGLTFPAWVYSSQSGSPHCSVTGGYVYRGSDVPALEGRYIYGDYCSGQLWALDDSGRPVTNEALAVGTFSTLTSFGEDAAGELYFVRQNGRVYRFFQEGTSDTVGVPERDEASLRLAGPNPFRGETALTFALAEAGPARVAVYDVLGREVAVLHDGPATAEAQAVRLAAGALPAGLYVVRLTSGSAEHTLKVMLVR
ncbi:MAG: PQQ-dependent sugar dehydrogenase [Rhodothermales bacterium]